MSAVWGGLVGPLGWGFFGFLGVIAMLMILAESEQEIPFPQFISE